MKNCLLLLALLLSLYACDKNSSDDFVDEDSPSEQVVTSRNMQFSFTTNAPGGPFAPAHVLAVWVESENGGFVRSLKVRAAQRIVYLYAWEAASQHNLTDAITGATITQHSDQVVDWNLQSYERNEVAPGNYKLMVEISDADSQGPLATFPFVFNDTVLIQSVGNMEFIEDVVIEYSQTLE